MAESATKRSTTARSPGLIDRLLDATVVPGFTKIGYSIRSRDFEPLPDAAGRTIVITGATAGLGLATARMVAAAGASVVLVARSRERGAAALEEIEPLLAPGEHAVFHPCDMADLDAVRKLASNLGRAHPNIDALVLNAGVLLQERVITDDGIELAWATNVIGPWILERGLLECLERTQGRVVMVTSGGAYTERLALPDADLVGEGYDGPAVYARTKRAQIALTQLHAEMFSDRGVAVHAVHPGWADTPGVKGSLPTFRKLTAPLLRTSDQGADTIAWLALADRTRLGSGLLWHDRMPRARTRLPGGADGPNDRERLESEIARLAGG